MRHKTTRLSNVSNPILRKTVYDLRTMPQFAPFETHFRINWRGWLSVVTQATVLHASDHIGPISASATAPKYQRRSLGRRRCCG